MSGIQKGVARKITQHGICFSFIGSFQQFCILKTYNQNPKSTITCSPEACKFNFGQVEITNLHACLASKILRTMNKLIMDMIDLLKICSLQCYLLHKTLTAHKKFCIDSKLPLSHCFVVPFTYLYGITS